MRQKTLTEKKSKRPLTFNPRGVQQVLQLLTNKIPPVLDHYFCVRDGRLELHVSYKIPATIVFDAEDFRKKPRQIVDDVINIMRSKKHAKSRRVRRRD